MQDTQIQTVVDLAEAATSAAPPLSGDQPKVPFQTALKLTAEQEKRMLDHAFKRLQELDDELGRSKTLNPNWWATSQGAQAAASRLLASQGLAVIGDTFLGKRSRYDATFYNDVTWRPFTLGANSIFWESNLVVPLSRRICRQMIARAQNSFFGSDPWFSIEPSPSPATEIDEHLSDRIEKFCRFKLDESNSKADKMRAIARSLILGECAVKTSYVVRDQLFDVEAVVLTDVEGVAIRGADGEPITHEEEWVDAEDGTGRRILARDKTTELPDAPIWQKTTINRRQVLFEGARSEPIYYKDFLCPPTATDVQTADTIVHLYDKPVMEFVDLVVKRGMIDGSTEARMQATQKMISLVKILASNSSEAKSASTQELRPGEYYIPSQSKQAGPIAEFAEFYMWFDANEDGIAENIMLIADRKTQTPILYDCVPNVTTDGLRPIEIVRVNPVEGRWYGLGVMELFESYQTITDLLVNRWNFSQSRSGRVDFWDPSATLEGERDPDLKMNWGGSYTLRPGKKPEEAVKPIYLNDTKFEQIQIMMQFFMQLAMNESGVTNANDNFVAGMDQAKLATGIVNIEKSGDELFNPLVNDLDAPLSAVLAREVNVTLANLNPEEVFLYLEGDTMKMETLTPDDVRGLRFKVKIELTTHKNQQTLQLSAQASALVEKFYSLPPNVQQHVVSFYRKQLRVLDPKANADEILVIQEMLMGEMPTLPNGDHEQNPSSESMEAKPPAMPMQLAQTHAQAKGVSAVGGTPKK